MPTPSEITTLRQLLPMPVMEVVPFSANLAGIALTAFGLAVIAHDGLLALIAFAATAAGVVVIAAQLLK